MLEICMRSIPEKVKYKPTPPRSPPPRPPPPNQDTPQSPLSPTTPPPSPTRSRYRNYDNTGLELTCVEVDLVEVDL